MKIASIVVLGVGSAGLMTALTLRRKLPNLAVRVIRSPGIGIIGVGEGTTVVFPRHFFEYLKMKPRDFYSEADPVLAEFLRKNPKVATRPRVVKFRSGRYARIWVGNVVAVGNATGFVEPLEATALQVICVEASTLADSLLDSLCEPTPTLVSLYNRYNGDQWDDIRNFLAIHYKFNTRLETPFWRACRSDTALHGAQAIVDWYRENGPSVLAGITLVHPSNSFRLDGYLTYTVRQEVPHARSYDAPPAETKVWRQHCQNLATEARAGMDVRDALQAIRSPGLKWA